MKKCPVLEHFSKDAMIFTVKQSIQRWYVDHKSFAMRSAEHEQFDKRDRVGAVDLDAMQYILLCCWIGFGRFTKP